MSEAHHGGGEDRIGDRAGEFFQKYLFFKFNPFSLESFIEWTGEWGISRALTLWIFYIGLMGVLSLQIPHLPIFAVEWLVGTAPLWLLIALYYSAVHAWVWYVQSLYLAGQNATAVLLEVKMPREVTRSPRAMELALIPFNISSGETTFLSRGWNGGTRPFWSFEITSFGGEVHFYIWTWKSWRSTVEATMYAYYPEVELVEVEDYAQKFKFDPKIHDTYCTDWRLETFMPGVSNDSFEINAYPFRTYIDFELDKDPKEEFKIDPLAQVVELLGAIRPEDQIWLQIVLRQCGKQGTFAVWDLLKKWKEMVKREVEKVRIESATFAGNIPVTEEQLRTARPRGTWRQQQQIETMERNLGKYPYEVGMRGWIVSSKEISGNYYNLMRWIWRPVGNPQYMTHLRPRRWHPPFDYPWQDFHSIRWNVAASRFLDAYRRRLFYFSPWKTPINILTNEEIATLWHPISSSISTPGLERIAATKAEPPANLPK